MGTIGSLIVLSVVLWIIVKMTKWMIEQIVDIRDTLRR